MRWMIGMLGVAVPSIAGAQTPPPPELHRYVVDEAASQLFVVVHRAGLLSFLGHEHAIVPGAWSADLCLDDSLSAGAHASVAIRTASLVIDSDSARDLAGMGGGPGAEDRETIQARMLDSTNLAATDFPQILLDVRAATAGPAQKGSAGGGGGADRIEAEGTITLRDVTREVELPVEVERADGGRLLMSGVLRIHLRDFGIEPESRAGVVKVSNDVDLHFRFSASPTDGRCAPAPGEGQRPAPRGAGG